MRVLIIEDSQQVVKDVSFCLQVRYPDIIMISVDTGRKGIDLIETEVPDLLIVDSSLPDIDVLSLISSIRDFSDIPLIILSDVETDMDRARNLEAGADEYVNKPFSPIELLAKVKALLRRTRGGSFRSESSISISDELTINFGTREVFLSGKRIRLTPIEYHLLSELIRNDGRVITHGRLLEKVWGSDYTNDYSFVKKYVYRLRAKIEPDASKPQMLLTERGIGYRFVKPI